MKQILIIMLFIVLVFQSVNLMLKVYPVQASAEVQMQNPLRIAAIKVGLGDPGEKILEAIALSSKQTGLSPNLLLALMYSESSLQPNAISSKGYQGLMQIPQSKLLLHQKEDVNILIGAHILKQKLAITSGDIKNAVVIYKGWQISDPRGQRKANEVLALARKLKEG